MNPADNRKFDALATFAVFGTIAFWTAGAIWIKYLTGFVDVWTQNWLRYVSACIFWLPLLFYDVRKGNLEPNIWRLALLPSLVNIIYQTLYIAIYYYLKPAFIMLLVQFSAIWIGGFSLVFFPQERALITSKRFWAGAILSIAGVVGVIVFKADFTATKTFTGILIALVSTVMWATYTISVKIAFKDVNSRRGFSVISIYTVCGLSVLAFIIGKPYECLEMTVWPWVCIVVSGILCIGISHVLYYFSIKRLGATIPAILLLATPCCALAMSYLFFKETLNIAQCLFGLILLVGCGLAVWAQGHLKKSNC